MIEAHNSILNSLHWVIDQKSSGKIKKLSQECFCTAFLIVEKNNDKNVATDAIKYFREAE